MMVIETMIAVFAAKGNLHLAYCGMNILLLWDCHYAENDETRYLKQGNPCQQPTSVAAIDD